MERFSPPESSRLVESPTSAADEVGSFSLSSFAQPFLPGGASGGRSKTLRWADDVEDAASDGDSLDRISPAAKPACRLSPMAGQIGVPPAMDPLRPPLRSILVCLGKEGHLAARGSLHGPGEAQQLRRRRRRGRGQQQRPHLVHGLPLRGHINRPLPRRAPAPRLHDVAAPPVKASLRPGPGMSRHHRASPPNVHGWQDIIPRGRQEPRQARKLLDAMAVEPKKTPVVNSLSCFHGRCFRCLARDHKVASCRDPPRCFRCNGSGHLSRHCSARRRHGNRRPGRTGSSLPRLSVHDRLRFPDEFPSLAATHVQQPPHESRQLRRVNINKDKRQAGANDAPLHPSYCAAVLGGGMRGRNRSPSRRGTRGYGRESGKGATQKPPPMVVEDPLMASMDKLKATSSITEESKRCVSDDPMLLEAYLGHMCYQSQSEEIKVDAGVPLEEDSNIEKPVSEPVLDVESVDTDSEEPSLQAVITPATRPIKTPARGGRRRSDLLEVRSAQRQSARLAAKPSIVPIARRAEHRLALQIEMLDPGIPTEPTGDEAVKMYLERYKGAPPSHVTAALAALASVQRGRQTVTLAGEEEEVE